MQSSEGYANVWLCRECGQFTFYKPETDLPEGMVRYCHNKLPDNNRCWGLIDRLSDQAVIVTRPRVPDTGAFGDAVH